MCIVCDENPKAHSFFKLATESGVHIYYSCPAEATNYWDKESVANHCREKLAEKEDAKWIFIFDGMGYTIRHALAIGVAHRFLGVIKEYADTLVEIRIVNMSKHVGTMISIMRPFIPSNIYKKINWETFK